MKVASSRIHCTSGYILETVQDSDVVTTNHQQEMIYDPSNRTVSDEWWPWVTFKIMHLLQAF